MRHGIDLTAVSESLPSEQERGAFTLDPVVLGDPGTRQAFEAQIGRAFVFPEFDSSGPGADQIHVRAARVQDFAASSVSFGPEMRAAGPADGLDDLAWLYVVDSGTWTIGEPGGADSQTVPAGRFLLRHDGRPMPSRTAPGTRARVTVLPSRLLTALPRDRVVTGPTDAAELRLLLAHMATIHATVADLGPAGVRAAHDAAIELTRAVAEGVADGSQLEFAPSLVRAAMTLATQLLSQPELSPDLLARQLGVSRRTLQRAFATEGESVAAYIRVQRLEAVRRALDVPLDRPSVTELAAHWQFADGSHLTRLFKRRFGLTPVDYARTGRAR